MTPSRDISLCYRFRLMGGAGETPCQNHTQERQGTDAHVDRSEPNQER